MKEIDTSVFDNISSKSKITCSSFTCAYQSYSRIESKPLSMYTNTRKDYKNNYIGTIKENNISIFLETYLKIG